MKYEDGETTAFNQLGPEGTLLPHETLVRINEYPGDNNGAFQLSESAAWVALARTYAPTSPTLSQFSREQIIAAAQKVLQYYEVYNVPRKPTVKYDAKVIITARVPMGWTSPDAVHNSGIANDMKHAEEFYGWDIRDVEVTAEAIEAKEEEDKKTW